MPDQYLEAPGEPSSPPELLLPKAKDLANVLSSGRVPYVRFIECHKWVEAGEMIGEVVVFDVEVELSQRARHGIEPVERIAVTFWADDKRLPETEGLRDSFPLVPHLNLRQQELPRSLCLFEEPYSELKLHWNPIWYIESLRGWLARTARGESHFQDQSLEPLLIGTGQVLVVPIAAFSTALSTVVTVRASQSGSNSPILIAEHGFSDWEANYMLTSVLGAPQTHGIIRKRPSNLFELHQFLEVADVNLIDVLRERLSTWYASMQPNNRDDLAKMGLIIVAILPMTRTPESSPETQDIWAFRCSVPIKKIGEMIGVWEIRSGKVSTLASHLADKKGDQIDIEVFNAVVPLIRDLANLQSGLVDRDDRRIRDTGINRRIVAVGAGALGSQVFTNLARMGYGRWTLIDNDFIYPHNLAKHALFGPQVGMPKAEALAQAANETIAGEPIAVSIVADILDPGSHALEVEQALGGATVILDMSTSIAVERHLARDVRSNARRVCLFMNPTGSDLVLLAEDRVRRTTLDLLEMQYYRQLITDNSLAEHLKPNKGRIRIGRSCRDITNTLPQELAALHAANGARALRMVLAEANAAIYIMRTDSAGLGISVTQVPTFERVEQRIGDWLVCTDKGLLEKVLRSRAEKLPNETGGVLLGTVDTKRQVIYVADTLPSPADSEETPTGYVRGRDGLIEKLAYAEAVTNQQISYVGEWHSHPCNYDCTASKIDMRSFRWLTEIRGWDNLPALMLIVGDNTEYGWYVAHQ